METHRVLCEVRNKSLCIILINFHIEDKAVQDCSRTVDPAMRRNTPELLNLQRHHCEHLTSCSSKYFLCARKLQIRIFFKLDTASGRS